MDVPGYPSNNTDKTEEKKVPTEPKVEDKTTDEKKVYKVVEGDVIRRKKTKSSAILETLQGAWGYVSTDVLLPAAKDMLSDAVAQGVDQVLFGEPRTTKRSRTRGGSSNGTVSYHKYSSRNKEPGPNRREPTISNRARATHDFDEIILATRIEAEEVIDRLFDLVSRYEIASVADLYELVGAQGKYTDSSWGWYDLRGATVRRTRSGYLLDLPAPEHLD